MNAIEKTKSGVKWVGLSMIVERGARFVTTAILAHLLTPEIFGLVAMAMVCTNLMGVVRQIGLSSAWVQRQAKSPEEDALALRVVFTMTMAMNASLWLIATLCIPLVVMFFEQPLLAPVLAVLLVGFLLEPFGEVPGLVLQKQLEFGKQAACGIAAGLLSAITGVALAFFGFGVWALVVATLVASIARAILRSWVVGWRPSFGFDREIAAELFRYGRFIWGFAVLSMVGGTVDRILVGRRLGAESLGAYNIGFNLCALPATVISTLVTRVTFPLFASARQDLAQLRHAVDRTVSLVAVASMPLAFGVLSTAESLVRVIYGEQWVDAVPVIKILGFHGMLLAVSSPMSSVLRATGRPHVLLWTSIVHHAVLFSALYILGGHGIVGIAYAVLAPMPISALIGLVAAGRAVALPLGRIMNSVIRSALTGAGMYGFVLIARMVSGLDPRVEPLPDLALSLLVGALSYFGVGLLINRQATVGFMRAIQRVGRITVDNSA